MTDDTETDTTRDEQTIDGIPLAVGVSPTDDWIDRHSVTCAICGGYADERESISLWDNPDYPNGEAHTQCFHYTESNGVSEAKNDLQALVKR